MSFVKKTVEEALRSVLSLSEHEAELTLAFACDEIGIPFQEFREVGNLKERALLIFGILLGMKLADARRFSGESWAGRKVGRVAVVCPACGTQNVLDVTLGDLRIGVEATFDIIRDDAPIGFKAARCCGCGEAISAKILKDDVDLRRKGW